MTRSETDSATNRDLSEELASRVVATSGVANPRDALRALFGRREGFTSVTDAFAKTGVPLRAEDFFQAEKTRHEIQFGDRVEYVPCVADALEAAILVDREPVVVRSLDPISERVVIFEITSSGFEALPSTAVMSFGMAADLSGSGDLTDHTIAALSGEKLPGGQDPEEFPKLVCRYINAFETQEHFETWAEGVDSVAIALPPEDFMPALRQFTPEVTS